MVISVNARFMNRPATGVDVHASEVLRRVSGLVTVNPPRRANSGFVAHGWEQVVLPLRTRQGVLWSPCNSGPVVSGAHLMTVHDAAPFDVPQFYSRNYRIMARVATKWSATRATRIATVSRFAADRLEAVLGVDSTRLHVVGNGVRSEMCGATRQVDESSPYLLTLGSLDPRKQLDRVIASYRRAAPDVPLRVIGGSNPRVFADHGIDVGDGIELLGYLPTEEVVAQVAGALAFVSFSAYEGFGMPPVDAAAVGVPVVVSDIGAHREVLGGIDGVYFAGDDDELDGLLSAASEGRLASPLGAVVRARHSWDEVAQRYVDLLRAEFDDDTVRFAGWSP